MPPFYLTMTISYLCIQIKKYILDALDKLLYPSLRINKDLANRSAKRFK